MATAFRSSWPYCIGELHAVPGIGSAPLASAASIMFPPRLLQEPHPAGVILNTGYCPAICSNSPSGARRELTQCPTARSASPGSYLLIAAETRSARPASQLKRIDSV